MPELTKEEKELLNKVFGPKSRSPQPDPAGESADEKPKKQPESGSVEAIIKSIFR